MNSQNTSLFYTDKNGIAMNGYDTVSYHLVGKAELGNQQYTSQYNKIKFLFASEEHKRLFEENPKKYIPAFGGYCAYGVAAEYPELYPTNPKNFLIQDGQLLLFYRGLIDMRSEWNPGNGSKLARADLLWTNAVQKLNTEEMPTILIDENSIAINGYDTVSYHLSGKAEIGKPECISMYSSAKFLFANEEHKRLFKEDPKKYIPAFGGYCAASIAANSPELYPGNPENFLLQEGRLLFFYRDVYDARTDWNKDANGI